MSKIHSIEKVAYSSIVGQSIRLMDDAGAYIGQLAVVGAENPQDIADQVVETFNAPNKHAYRMGRAQGRASLLTAIERAYVSASDGMSLRDYFAGQAISGILAGYWGNYEMGGMDSKSLSKEAYYMADAMLATRTA